MPNYSENPPATPYVSGVVSVGTTATLLATVVNTDGGVLVNNAGAVIIYLGGTAVTSSTGLPVAAGATITIPSIAGVSLQLYAVAASSTANVSYLYAPQ